MKHYNTYRVQQQREEETEPLEFHAWVLMLVEFRRLQADRFILVPHELLVRLRIH